MATIKGVWVFNEILTLPDNRILQTVNFISDGKTGSSIDVQHLSPEPEVYYDGVDFDYYPVCMGVWDKEAFRTIDFGTTVQEVSEEFYTWFTANAVQQSVEPESTVTFDLSTLNLSAGTHSIHVTLSGDGYRESVASNTLEYVVEEVVNTYNITTNLVNCYSLSTNPTQISEGEEIALTIYADSGYKFASGLSVSGAEFEWTFNTSEANIILCNPTGDVTVDLSAVKVANTYNITTNLSSCVGYSTNPTEIDDGGEVILQFSPYSGYQLPPSVSVSGAEYEWIQSSGTLVLRNPTGTVYISISCAGNCCFAAGTPVLMSDGTFKNIENIVAGDIVMTFNEESEVYEPGTVIYFFVKPNTQDMAKLIFEDGTEITMNAYHPMYTTDGWKSLTGSGGLPILTKEDTILSTDKKWVKISDIVRWFSDEYITTYNLDVENNDNYFVGKTPVMASNAEFVTSPCAKPAPEVTV